jgi:hypothetical protein
MRAIDDPVLWALPIQPTADDVRGLADRARTCGRRLVMHRLTLMTVARALNLLVMTPPVGLIERALKVRIELDIMYPEGVIALLPN